MYLQKILELANYIREKQKQEDEELAEALRMHNKRMQRLSQSSIMMDRSNAPSVQKQTELSPA
jgi:uncharacterized UPF0160 family protein